MTGTIYDAHMAATDLLGCVCEALTLAASQNDALQGCPCRTGVVAGSPSWEGCDTPCAAPDGGPLPDDQAGGQLTVNIVRVFESTPSRFPAETRVVRSLKQCDPVVTVVELDVTLLRCAPVGDGDCPPETAELQSVAFALSADMMEVRNAVECCYAGTLVGRRNLRGRRYILGPATVLGPQGGCVGFVQRVTVELAEPICCPEPETPVTASQDTLEAL